jgi:small-conductance mechanosensitive channel
MMIFDIDFWTQLWSDFLSAAVMWLPRFVGALVLIILGWFVGRLVQFVLSNLLRRLGLNRFAERAGIHKLFSDAGLGSSATVTNLIARFFFWIIFLIFLIAATESLGLPGVVDTLGNLLNYLPRVLAAALILLLGILIAGLVGDVLGTLTTQAGVATGALLGKVVRYVIITFAMILALEQLGFETTLLIATMIIIISMTTLAMALAFGIGSRELARNIMAGFHTKDTFTIGQQLSVRGHMGRLVSIGTVKITLETEEGMVSLPNSILTDEEVTLIPEKNEPS